MLKESAKTAKTVAYRLREVRSKPTSPSAATAVSVSPAAAKEASEGNVEAAGWFAEVSKSVLARPETEPDLPKVHVGGGH